MNKNDILSKLIKNSEKYEPEHYFENLMKYKSHLKNNFIKYYNKYGNVINELYKSNPILKIENKEIKRELELKSEIGKSNYKLEKGNVAAIDGTTNMELDSLHFIKYFSIVVGSVSYGRGFEKTAEHWNTTIEVSELMEEEDNNTNFVISTMDIETNIDSSVSDFMLFKERELATRLKEEYIFLDGCIFYEKLLKNKKSVTVYQELMKNKKVIGIIKDLNHNKELNNVASNLNSGTIRIVKTTQEDLKEDYSSIGINFDKILKGVFKIKNKAYGFEVHEDLLEEMITLVFNDCTKDSTSYEIPWLLTAIDKSIKNYKNNKNINETVKSEIISEMESDEDKEKIRNLLMHERKLR